MTIVYKVLFHTRVGTHSSTSLDPTLARRPSSSNRQYLLACSANQAQFEAIFYKSSGRNPAACPDRKGFLDHLHSSKLVKSTIRVTATQASQVMSHFMKDQLDEEMRLDDQVWAGTMTREQAKKESDEWYEREWKKRYYDFIHHRLPVALAKYQSITLVMRLYEYIASKFVDKETMDKLTYDTFNASKRAHDQGIQGRELFKDMFQVCWNANLISFLADYSVHEVILLAGYYFYIQDQRKRRKNRRISDDDSDNSDQEPMAGALVLSFLKKSTKLAITRVVSLGFASLGGAVGAVLNPTWGWATLIGTNLGEGIGDTIGASFVEDGAGSL